MNHLPTTEKLTQEEILNKLCRDPSYLREQQSAWLETQEGTGPPWNPYGWVRSDKLICKVSMFLKWIEKNQEGCER